METYQAVYDAVRSRISGFDGQALIDKIAYQFDISHLKEILQQNFSIAANEMQRPSVLYRPKLSVDGNQWCALYGDNLQDGIAAFGDSPADAMSKFDREWYRNVNHEDNA